MTLLKLYSLGGILDIKVDPVIISWDPVRINNLKPLEF